MNAARFKKLAFAESVSRREWADFKERCMESMQKRPTVGQLNEMEFAVLKAKKGDRAKEMAKLMDLHFTHLLPQQVSEAVRDSTDDPERMVDMLQFVSERGGSLGGVVDSDWVSNVMAMRWALNRDSYTFEFQLLKCCVLHGHHLNPNKKKHREVYRELFLYHLHKMKMDSINKSLVGYFLQRNGRTMCEFFRERLRKMEESSNTTAEEDVEKLDLHDPAIVVRVMEGCMGTEIKDWSKLHVDVGGEPIDCGWVDDVHAEKVGMREYAPGGSKAKKLQEEFAEWWRAEMMRRR